MFSSGSCPQTSLVVRSLLYEKDQVSHPYKTTTKTVVLYVVIFRVLRLEDEKTKYGEPNGTKHSRNLICLPFLCECKFKCGLRITKYLNDNKHNTQHEQILVRRNGPIS